MGHVPSTSVFTFDLLVIMELTVLLTAESPPAFCWNKGWRNKEKQQKIQKETHCSYHVGNAVTANCVQILVLLVQKASQRLNNLE